MDYKKSLSAAGLPRNHSAIGWLKYNRLQIFFRARPSMTIIWSGPVFPIWVREAQ